MPTQPQVEVTQLWGEAVLEVRRFAPGAGVTIGDGPDVDLYADASDNAGRIGESQVIRITITP